MTAMQKYRKLILYRNEHPAESGHKHHVIPRCLHPKSNKTVMLTEMEHAIAHYWLYLHFNSMRKFRNKGLAMYMRAAFIGLRKPLFRSRWRCTLEKEWKTYVAGFARKLFKGESAK